MRIGTANEGACISLIAFTAITDAALKERIAARMEDGMARLIVGMLSHAVERLQKNADIQPCAVCNP